MQSTPDRLFYVNQSLFFYGSPMSKQNQPDTQSSVTPETVQTTCTPSTNNSTLNYQNHCKESLVNPQQELSSSQIQEPSCEALLEAVKVEPHARLHFQVLTLVSLLSLTIKMTCLQTQLLRLEMAKLS